VNESSRKKPPEENAGAATANRRRLGTIVHDERGNALVEWRDAPADEQRPVLEILGDPQLALQSEESYDPYARHAASLPKPNPGNTTRTDLRKLSEWIKMKRELEARKLRGELDEDDKEG
jgi:hypothetical protein